MTGLQIGMSFVTAIVGGICASAAMMGHFTDRLNVIERLLFAVAAILFMNSDWRVDLAAFAMLAGLVFWTLRRATPSAEPELQAGQNPQDLIQKEETK